MLGRSLWAAGRAEIDGDRLRVEGWRLPPEGEHTPIGLAINGRPFARFEGDRPWPDLAGVFAFIPGAVRLGFEAEVALTADERAGVAPIDVDLVDLDTLQPLRAWQSISVKPPHTERWPMPDEARIRRVHGRPDAHGFRLAGFTHYRKLDRALRESTGRGLAGCRRILDWGCGCGRLLRYLADLPGAALVGADIDADNLQWCRRQLPCADYVDLALLPPSPIAAESVDLVIGISVFTHLAESAQLAWLDELHRIGSPGAVYLMSIHGPAVHATSASLDFCRTIEERGIVDGRSPDLDDVLEDREYYRTTFHSHAYVRREWGRRFEIVGMLPACIGMQDLVVMRKSGPPDAAASPSTRLR